MGIETPKGFKVGLENQQIPGFSDDATLVRAAFTDLVLHKSEYLGSDLQQAMIEAMLVDCPNDYLNQQRALVALYRDYLPKSACLNVLAEVGVSRYLASAEAEEDRAFTLRTFGAEIAGQMIIDADFFSEAELSDPESLKNITQKLQKMLTLRAKAARVLGSSISTKFQHSFLAAFSFDRPGADVTNDPNSEHSKLESAITNYTFILKSKDKLYKMCLGEKVLREAYGEAFWVLDLPCAGSILYTPEGFRNLSESSPLLSSNILHEPVHILIAHGLPVTIKDELGQVSLNGNLVLPDWFKEGYANVICARFRGSYDFEYDFLDLFLRSWDGTIPASAEILKGDTNVSYFIYTLFVTYYFQIAGMDWSEWQHPRYLAEPIPVSFLNLFSIFTMCSRFPIGLQKQGDDQNLPQQMIERNFEYMQHWIRHMDARSKEVMAEEGRKSIPQYAHPQTGAVLPIISFGEFCKLFDANRNEFARNWLEIHASERHTQLLLQRPEMAEDPLVKKIRGKRSDVGLPPNDAATKAAVDHDQILETGFDRKKHIKALRHHVRMLETKVQQYLYVVTKDSGIFDHSIDEITQWFEMAPEKMREKFPSLPDGLWYFFRQVNNVDLLTYDLLPKRFYLRMISEAAVLSLQIPSEPAGVERAKTVRLLNGHTNLIDQELRKNFTTDLEQKAIRYIQSFGAGIGGILYERTFNKDLIRHLTSIHFKNLINLNKTKHNSSSFIKPFDGEESLIGLFARAGDTDIEGARYDIMKKLTSLCYLYVHLDTYYKQVRAGMSENLLVANEHDKFWAREHTVSSTLLETERAVQLLEGMLGADHLLHEMMHFIICRVFHVALEVNSKLYRFNAEGVLPVALHEGLANLFVSRYMTSYDGVYDFTDLSDYFETIPEILSAEEILRADTKTSYVHFTVFCGFIMQYIDALVQNPNIDPLVFLQVPNQVSMRRGAFWFIRANRECVSSKPLNVSSKFEGDIGVAYVRHVFSNLRTLVLSQRDVDVPEFDTLCALFDEHKDEFWRWWKIEFAKRQLEEHVFQKLNSKEKVPQ